MIVGHVPRALSAVCCLLLGKGGTIFCEVTGRRRFSADLPQGGLEVPCTLIFTGAGKYIAKVQKLVQLARSSGLDLSFTASEPGSLPEQPNKKLKTEKDEDSWLLTLSQFDKKALCDGKRLNDNHINFAQGLLRKQFPSIDGLKLTLLRTKQQTKIKHGLQIIHSRGNHWIVASTLGCYKDEVKLFDSLYASVDRGHTFYNTQSVSN